MGESDKCGGKLQRLRPVQGRGRERMHWRLNETLPSPQKRRAHAHETRSGARRTFRRKKGRLTAILRGFAGKKLPEGNSQCGNSGLVGNLM